VYTPVLVGGSLNDFTPQTDTQIGSKYAGKSFVNVLSSKGTWTFKDSVQKQTKVNDWPGIGKIGFEWSDFEWLAKNIKDSRANGYSVKVYTKGGMYNMYKVPGATQGYDKGKSLIVFNTKEPIRLIATSDGRQFGPSVLAPFSEVTLAGAAGFIDGFVIAKVFKSNGNGLQMHGDFYKGPLTCK
jgi:hypothetical protein